MQRDKGARWVPSSSRKRKVLRRSVAVLFCELPGLNSHPTARRPETLLRRPFKKGRARLVIILQPLWSGNHETDAGAQYRLLELDGTKACPVDHGPIDFSSSGGVVNEYGSSIERTRGPSMDQARAYWRGIQGPCTRCCEGIETLYGGRPRKYRILCDGTCKNPTA